LAVSELLWLWQSWPVREAVDVVQAESAGLSC
jgi:hypothetical protein